MDASDELKDLSTQITSAIKLLESAQCNQNASNLLIKRLKLVAFTFGDLEKGFMTHSATHSTPLPINKITELEEGISSYLGYATRFIRPDYLLHILIDRTPEYKLIKLDKTITDSMNEIAKSLDIKDEFIPTPEYKVACDLLETIRQYQKQHISWDTYVTQQAIARGIVDPAEAFTTTLKGEMEAINLLTNEHIEESLIVIRHEPYCILKQKAIRKFWSEQVHPLPLIPLDQFSHKLTQYMSTGKAPVGEGSSLSTEDITLLVSKLEGGLLLESKKINGIDAYLLAQVSRSIPSDESDFVSVISKVADALSRHQVLLLPSFDVSTEQVYYAGIKLTLLYAALPYHTRVYVCL